MEFKSIDSYHGTGAFDIEKFPSWNSLFLELVDRPAETVVVVSKRTRRRHRGWAYQQNYLDNLGKKEEDTRREDEPKENPFLEEVRQNEPMIDVVHKIQYVYCSNLFVVLQITVEYELDIDPASLVNRIMSVREQISKEWERDLETMIRSNDEILVSYADHQREARAASEGDDDEEDDEDEDLQDLTSPYSDRSEDKVMLFDKNAMVMLTNSIASQDRESSPFRRSNFDLLLLLSTQESIHRVLREYAGQDERMENFEWLRAFYVDRVGKHFDGHGQGYGRAEAFLEELLFCLPVLQKTRNGDVHLIDPMGMAEDIIRERSEVAREWKEMFADTPQAHIDMRRLLLTRRMMEITEKTLAAAPVKEMFEGAGAFE